MKTSRTIIDPGGLGKSPEPRLSRVGDSDAQVVANVYTTMIRVQTISIL